MLKKVRKLFKWLFALGTTKNEVNTDFISTQSLFKTSWVISNLLWQMMV
jgi:hypothetical protein